MYQAREMIRLAQSRLEDGKKGDEMNSLQWAQALFSLLPRIPTAISEVEEAVNHHWGQDHVEQARYGAQELARVLNIAATGMASGNISPEPSPEMGIAPPAPQEAEKNARAAQP